ncbi:MAG: hypothetical protein ACOYMA_08555 [Bacteroidia bacterium]
MEDHVLVFKLYLPIIGSLFFMMIAIFSKENNTEPIILQFEKFGFKINTQISNLFLRRIICVTLSILTLSFYISYDFTYYFPKQLKMQVFFDKIGINKAIDDILSDKEKNDLKIIVNFDLEYNNYFRHADSILETISDKTSFFTSPNALKLIHSNGETTFIVNKVDGIQKYHITESKGQLTHSLERPGEEIMKVFSNFEKIDSRDDNINLSFKHLFSKGEILLRPQFKQMISENHKPSGYLFANILVGVTKLYFFPFPKFSNTIYFLQLENDSLVPIGYTLYN